MLGEKETKKKRAGRCGDVPDELAERIEMMRGEMGGGLVSFVGR